MAITRAQQARQMLKTAGAVEQDGVLNYIKNSFLFDLRDL